MRTCSLVLLILALFCIHLSAQQTAGEVQVTINGQVYPVYTHSYALLIGVSEYSNGWPSLPGVREDLLRIREALEKQGFTVMAIWDPDKDQIDDAITEFIRNFGQDTHNRLLIWYAGHGYTSVTSYGEQIGYLVPFDAPRPHLGFGQFQAKALEIAQFDLFSKRIQSNHALFVFDACFSGSLFTGKSLPAPLSVKALEPVREFITSGSADEQVPDESIFCRQFIQALNGEADRDNDGYITGTELGDYLQKSVVNYSRNTQHPQYGKIRNPRLDEGEIIFVSFPKPFTITLPAELEQKPPTPAGQNKSFAPSTGTGELKIITNRTGDLFIDGVFYRTLVANSTVMLFNIPTGRRLLELRGSDPWQSEMEIKPEGVTVVDIK